MMLLARLAILAAACCTLWFNGAYAWSKGGNDLAHQLGMVAANVTIDLAKCALLPAAAYLAASGMRLRAIAAVMLWFPAITISTFSGYAYLHSHRAAASVTDEATASIRQRAQAAYDAATIDIDTAKASPLWKSTAACTAINGKQQRAFCAAITEATKRQQTASTQLGTAKAVRVDPEIAALGSFTDMSRDTLAFLSALAPALFIELLASLGAYALAPPPRTRTPEASHKPVGGPIEPPHPAPAPISQNHPAASPEAFPTPSAPTPPRQLKWPPRAAR